MCNTAAFLVDCVLPNLPVRQWVLSLPWEVRSLTAAKPDVLAAIGRIFVETVFREQRKECGHRRAASMLASAVASAPSSAPGMRQVALAGLNPAYTIRAFNVITIRHLDRLLGGELMATGPRLDWARLLRRTHGFDPLDCPNCGGRLRAIAAITERESIDRILEAVGYERRTPPNPTQLGAHIKVQRLCRRKRLGNARV